MTFVLLTVAISYPDNGFFDFPQSNGTTYPNISLFISQLEFLYKNRFGKVGNIIGGNLLEPTNRRFLFPLFDEKNLLV